jgi:hypothetical protein
MRAFILLCAFLVALASPACAADDVAAAQSVIRSQEQAFSRDDAAAAYSYAAPAIKGIFPRAEIFIDTNGEAWEALYTLEQQPDGSLKITGCSLLKAGQAV